MTYLSSSSSGRLMPWVIWGLGALAFFIEYIIRVSPAAMVPNLMSTFVASSLTVSSFAAYFLYAYVGMQIPVGILVDRFGPHLCLFLSTVVCALCTFWFASTHHLLSAQFARVFFGLGAAFALISTLKLAMNWFKPQLFSILVGISQSLGMIGGALGVGLMGRLIDQYGWQESTILLAFFLALLALFIFLFVRNGPQQQSIPKETLPVLQALKRVLRHKQTWLLSIYAGLLYMPTAVFAEFWGSFYLTTTKGLPTTIANDGISLIFFGSALGGPIAGMLANHLGRRHVMILSASCGLILMPCILYAPIFSIPFLYFLLFIFGFCNTGTIAAYTAIAEINPKTVTGVALGFGNGMSVLVGAFCQQLVGALIDIFRAQRSAVGINDYTAFELKMAMLIVVIGSITTFILSFFTQETLKK